MKIKLTVRTTPMAGEVALDELRAALNNIGYEENKDYSIETYKPRPEGK